MNEHSDAAAGLLQQAVEALSDGFVVFDHEHRLVLCNQRFRDIYHPIAAGWKAGSPLSAIARDIAIHCLGLSAKDEIDAFVRRRTEQFENPGPMFDQHMLDGRWIGVRDSLLPNGWVVGTRTDITQLKKAEAELQSLTEELEQRVAIRTAELDRIKTELERQVEERRLAVERFSDFADVAADWFWETDADLRYTYFSERVTEVTGVPVEFHIGKTRQELAGESVQTQKWRGHLDDLAHRRRFRRFTFRRKGHDGRMQWMLASGKPVYDDEGEFAGYRGSGTEITAEMEATEALRAAKEAAERNALELREAQAQLLRQERLAAVGQLTASVAHELRNPLGSINNALVSIERLAPDANSLLAHSIALGLRNIGRCDRIISELLDFTRTGELRKQPVNFDTWMADVLDEFPVPDGVQLVRSLHCAATAIIDSVRMKQVVDNLLYNACHAMRERSTAAPEREPRLYVSTACSDASLEFQVDDTGPGISDDIAAHVFEPLYTTKNFGLGLGLPIVKRIVEQHGGSVTLGAAPSGGARAAIRLPLD